MKKKILGISLFLFSFSFFSYAATQLRIVNDKDTTERKGLEYVKGEDTPFTGIVRREFKKDNSITDMEFKNGIQDGITKSYYPNGALKGEIHFVKGKIQGQAKMYYDTGELRILDTIKNDRPNGTRIIYFKNGSVKEEIPYKKGKKWGTHKSYYPSGKLKAFIEYKDGAKFYDAKLYQEDGKILKSAYFESDIIKQRSEFTYHSNGNLKMEITYDLKDSPEYGLGLYCEIKHYDEEGRLKNIILSKVPVKDKANDVTSKRFLKDEKPIEEDYGME